MNLTIRKSANIYGIDFTSDLACVARHNSDRRYTCKRSCVVHHSHNWELEAVITVHCEIIKINL
jgi:hypothetical protein